MSLVEAREAAADAALGRVLTFLASAAYRFVMPTPATHALVSARHAGARPGDLRDIFGWTRPFAASDLPAAVLDDLRAGDVLREQDGLLSLSIRVSTIGDRLHIHSAASRDPDAVFLGPDSYRFVRLIEATLADGEPVRRAVDIGAGAGAGALALAALRPGAQVWATDVNPAALRFLSINAAHARARVLPVEGRGLGGASGGFDLIVANPPYVAGEGGRVYRDGGGGLGTDLALAWVREGLPRLTVGGRFVLYTGSPIVDGRDLVAEGVTAMVPPGFEIDRQELDPDVFGSMLRGAAYRDVERIAAIGLVVRRRA